jgi:acyl carrier protein
MDKTQDVLQVLDEVLSMQGRALRFKSDTRLLGGIPELDSMAVVGVITALEERFGITIDDDEIDGSTFATVGSLAGFVNGKTGG